MRTIWGKTIEGSVHDCNKKYLLRALKDYDQQLYIKWNPLKNGGLGLWEVRRRPNQKTAVPRWEVGRSIVFELQYVENDLTNHVMDVEALNYSILTRIREMDTYRVKNWVDDLEYREDKAHSEGLKKNRENLKYQLRYHKRAMSDFKEMVRSGHAISDILSGRKK